MIEALHEFPLLVAQLTSNKCRFGELRLLASASTGTSKKVDCSVLLFRFQRGDLWPVELCRQSTSGKATLVVQQDGTVLVGGTVSASVQISNAFTEKVGRLEDISGELELAFSLTFSRKPDATADGPWSVNGFVDVVRSQLRTVSWNSPSGKVFSVTGHARLFKEDRTGGFVSKGAVKGQLFLPLVPIVIEGTSEATSKALNNFEELLKSADGLWSTSNISIISKASREPSVLRISNEVKKEAFSGIITNLQIELLNQFRGRLDGVPVVLLEQFGRGQTEKGTPMACGVYIKADHSSNPLALAHEVGHVLGGEHDNVTKVGAGRWAELGGAATVMQAADINQGVLGKLAKLNAPRWALFREISPNPSEDGASSLKRIGAGSRR